MKPFPIKKREGRNKLFVPNIRGSLVKPRPPKKLILDVHVPKVYVEFVFNDLSPTTSPRSA